MGTTLRGVGLCLLDDMVRVEHSWEPTKRVGTRVYSVGEIKSRVTLNYSISTPRECDRTDLR